MDVSLTFNKVTVDQLVRLFTEIQDTDKFGPRNQHAGLLELTSVKLSLTSPEIFALCGHPKVISYLLP